jgi:hypothetical protein
MAGNIVIMLSLEEWLISINVDEYLNNLVSDGWDCMSSLLFLTEDDLISIGVDKAGHRRRLIHKIDKLCEQQQHQEREQIHTSSTLDNTTTQLKVAETLSSIH